MCRSGSRPSNLVPVPQCETTEHIRSVHFRDMARIACARTSPRILAPRLQPRHCAGGRSSTCESDDRRRFLALLAREVRRGRIRLHAFSPDAESLPLARGDDPRGSWIVAMRDLCRDYSRQFNRATRPRRCSVQGTLRVEADAVPRSTAATFSLYIDQKCRQSPVMADGCRGVRVGECQATSIADSDACPAWLTVELGRAPSLLNGLGSKGLPAALTIREPSLARQQQRELAELGRGVAMLSTALRDPHREGSRATRGLGGVAASSAPSRRTAARGGCPWLPSRRSVRLLRARRRDGEGEWSIRWTHVEYLRDLWGIAEVGLDRRSRRAARIQGMRREDCGVHKDRRPSSTGGELALGASSGPSPPTAPKLQTIAGRNVATSAQGAARARGVRHWARATPSCCMNGGIGGTEEPGSMVIRSPGADLPPSNLVRREVSIRNCPGTP